MALKWVADQIIIRLLTVFIGLGLVFLGLFFPMQSWSLLSVRCMYGTGCLPKSRIRDREKAKYLLKIMKNK